MKNKNINKINLVVAVVIQLFFMASCSKEIKLEGQIINKYAKPYAVLKVEDTSHAIQKRRTIYIYSSKANDKRARAATVMSAALSGIKQYNLHFVQVVLQANNSSFGLSRDGRDIASANYSPSGEGYSAGGIVTFKDFTWEVTTSGPDHISEKLALMYRVSRELETKNPSLLDANDDIWLPTLSNAMGISLDELDALDTLSYEHDVWLKVDGDKRVTVNKFDL